jgi:hypothetical protein
MKYTFLIKSLLILALLANALPAYSAVTRVTLKVPVKITNFPPRTYKSLDLVCQQASPNPISRPIPISQDGNYEGIISMDVTFGEGVRDWECSIMTGGFRGTTIDNGYADTSKPQIYTVKGRL